MSVINITRKTFMYNQQKTVQHKKIKMDEYFILEAKNQMVLLIYDRFLYFLIWVGFDCHFQHFPSKNCTRNKLVYEWFPFVYIILKSKRMTIWDSIVGLKNELALVNYFILCLNFDKGIDFFSKLLTCRYLIISISLTDFI